MSLSKFVNIDAAVQHAKALRKQPMTAAQVVEVVTLEAELVNLGIGYVAVPVSAAEVSTKPADAPARAVEKPATRVKAEKPEKSAPQAAVLKEDMPIAEKLPDGF